MVASGAGMGVGAGVGITGSLINSIFE